MAEQKHPSTVTVMDPIGVNVRFHVQGKARMQPSWERIHESCPERHLLIAGLSTRGSRVDVTSIPERQQSGLGARIREFFGINTLARVSSAS